MLARLVVLSRSNSRVVAPQHHRAFMDTLLTMSDDSLHLFTSHYVWSLSRNVEKDKFRQVCQFKGA